MYVYIVYQNNMYTYMYIYIYISIYISTGVCCRPPGLCATPARSQSSIRGLMLLSPPA